MGAIANNFGPKGALIVGVIGFVVFYFLIPAALEAWLEYNKAKLTGPVSSATGRYSTRYSTSDSFAFLSGRASPRCFYARPLRFGRPLPRSR